MQEGRVRYREIAVITGDLPGYGKEITHQFTQNQIPHFLDDKKNVLDNCLVELIRASLEAVRQDFSYESVMRFLRTGLVSQDRTMMDRLENYILAMGIRGGKRFRATWEQTYRGAGDLNITELNAFKERALAPLFAMQETFRQEHLTIAGMTDAVLALLTDCRTEEKLGIRSCDRTVKTAVRSSGRRVREPERVSGDSGCRFCGAEGGCDPGGGRPRCGGRYYPNPSGSY